MKKSFELWKIVVVSIIPLIIYQYFKEQPPKTSPSDNLTAPEEEKVKKSLIDNKNFDDNAIKYWVDVDAEEGIKPYESVIAVLDYMGHQKIEMEIERRPTEEIHHYNWDFLYTWQHFETTKIKIDFKKLTQHHRINHLPGIRKIADIVSLASSSMYIPEIFTNHLDLEEFVNENPSIKFVEKSTADKTFVNIQKNYRNIKFRDESSYAQAIVNNPLLVDGHLFHFGIYVVVTSVNPLRAYYYIGNCLLRVASEKFDENDITNAKQFSINSDSFIGNDEFAAFDKYRSKKYTDMDILKTIIRERDGEPSTVFEQVEDCIDFILHSKESEIWKSIKATKSSFGKINFFEILRFDFYLNEEFQLYLSEVVISPQLAGYEKVGIADPAKPLSRSILYNAFNILGIGSYLKMNHIRDLAKYYIEFLANSNQISVNPEICVNSPCINSCQEEECKVCMRCIDDEFHNDLKFAYLEHLNMGDMKRVSPRSYAIISDLDETHWNQTTKSNRLYAKWLIGMCEKNEKFC